MQSELLDRLEIRELVENWVIWRDTGDWDRLRSLWFDDGRMVATWTQCSADEFIKMAQGAWARGALGVHAQTGQSIDVAGARAISHTKMSIAQRAEVHGVMVDVVCQGRFYDFLEKRDGRWGIVLRQPIYDRDRMDPIVAGTRLDLDQALLTRFPEGYRHLAYLQTKAGFDVSKDLPGARGDAIEAVYRSGSAWLAGEPLDR